MKQFKLNEKQKKGWWFLFILYTFHGDFTYDVRDFAILCDPFLCHFVRTPREIDNRQLCESRLSCKHLHICTLTFQAPRENYHLPYDDWQGSPETAISRLYDPFEDWRRLTYSFFRIGICIMLHIVAIPCSNVQRTQRSVRWTFHKNITLLPFSLLF